VECALSQWNFPCRSCQDSPPEPLPGYVGCTSGSIGATAANTLSDPPDGGTTNHPGYNPFPFYYPLQTEVLPCENAPGNPVCCNQRSHICLVTADNKLTFYDVPRGGWNNTPASGNPPADSFKGFTTTLVGVSSQYKPGSQPCSANSAYYCTPIYSWTWNSTFNGTAGGITLSNGLRYRSIPP